MTYIQHRVPCCRAKWEEKHSNKQKDIIVSTELVNIVLTGDYANAVPSSAQALVAITSTGERKVVVTIDNYLCDANGTEITIYQDSLMSLSPEWTNLSELDQVEYTSDMSGGGASPAYDKYGFLLLSIMGNSFIPVISGGRFRVMARTDAENENQLVLLTGTSGSGSSMIFTERNLQNFPENAQQIIQQFITIYGLSNYRISNDAKTIDVFNHHLAANEFVYHNDDVFSRYGFVEGKARIITDYGNIACVVKNGTLYPIISQSGNTFTNLYLNENNDVSDLSTMIQSASQYIIGDIHGGTWSEIQSELSFDTTPVTGGDYTTGTAKGNQFPGLIYDVNLQ